jgi:formate dehydrogenase iron-sulfur subunit
MEACPTGALVRNEFGDVYLQPDICNGCGYCVPSCPFGVVELNLDDGRAFKCTLCYDRQKDGIEPACAKACPKTPYCHRTMFCPASWQAWLPRHF